MKKKLILVTGGAGFIGSHVNKMLHEAHYDTIILDNLSRGARQAVTCGTLIEGDIADGEFLDKLFNDYKVDAVMHFAAYIDVGESCSNPLKYYQNNVIGTLSLLDAMLRNQVKTFIFSSTAAVYGYPQAEKITETHPCNPINPYGQTKWMIETILRDLNQAHGLQFCCLRYFNAAGGDPQGLIKNYKAKESNLIPIILRSLKQPDGKIFINGTDYETADGTCIRDYIHIEDLGSAHIKAMEKLFEGAKSQSYNLGNGRGYSIREVIQAVERVTGHKVHATEGPRRAGDPAVLIACADKANHELDWAPKYGLDDMILHAWTALS